MKANIFRSVCRQYMELRHIKTREQLRVHTTCGSNKTFGKYWKDPELMPIGMYLQIMSALNVPFEEQMQIFRKGK